VLVEIKSNWTNSLSLDFAMIRNIKPYAKLAKGHLTIKESTLLDKPLQLIMFDMET
jgi:hypothetical protein